MPHFFVKSNNINNNEIIIDDKENFNHISKSLRAKIGEKLLLIDENQIQYETVIFEISKNIIKCEIKNKYKSNKDLGFNLFLAQSPLRSDAQNFIIEKATELGVRGIYPVVTENCVLKKSVIEAKIEKWQKCMYEASKQCERAIIPICYEASSLEDVLDKNFDKVLVMAERSCELSLKNYLIENPILKNENVSKLMRSCLLSSLSIPPYKGVLDRTRLTAMHVRRAMLGLLLSQLSFQAHLIFLD